MARASRRRAPRRAALVATLATASALLAWQLVALRGGVTADMVSSPASVLRAAGDLVVSGELLRHGWLSLQELAGGFALAAVVGIVLGVALGRSRWLCGLLDPVVMAFNVTPRVALLPLLVLWVGIGVASKVAVVFLGAVFPIVVNTQAGARHVEALSIQATRAFGASPLQVVRLVVLPATLPAVMTGLRLGFGRAVVGVIVGEMYVSIGGVGHLLHLYGNAGRMAEMMALALMVTACGAAGVAVLRRLEARLAPWRQDLEA